MNNMTQNVYERAYDQCIARLESVKQESNLPSHWPEIKTLLKGKNADKIIQAFVSHTDSVIATYLASETLKECQKNKEKRMRELYDFLGEDTLWKMAYVGREEEYFEETGQALNH